MLNPILQYTPHKLISLSEHKYSDYSFYWHKAPGKTSFSNSKLWEVAKVLEGKACCRAAQIRRIRELNGKTDLRGAGETTILSSKYSRENNMVWHILVVMPVVSTKVYMLYSPTKTSETTLPVLILNTEFPITWSPIAS